jgi:hypothetical protein
LTATSGLLSFFLLGCPGSLDPGVGGGGDGGGTGGTTGTPGCEVALLANRCASCHGSASNSAGLDLQSANPGARLVGVTAFTGTGAACAGRNLLDPASNPATGVFIDKITLAVPCGLTMPVGSTLSMAEKTCLTTWATIVTTGSP